ncbi:nucleotidyltransferase family protein [Candidatus Woesearchaeota archaeon]|nr:nucleotidyltransferase family protein [Candidatus Woesearchaeota archaeon]
MVYTEIKERNGKKYFYRVISIRNKNKVSKKREYLGINLSKKELSFKEKEADKVLNLKNIEKKNKAIEKLKPIIIKILKKHGVKRAGIFGSYARGEQKKNSDIDILADIPKKVNLFDFVGIKLELEDALKKKVDLVEYKLIRPELKNIILNEEVKIL